MGHDKQCTLRERESLDHNAWPLRVHGWDMGRVGLDLLKHGSRIAQFDRCPTSACKPFSAIFRCYHSRPTSHRLPTRTYRPPHLPASVCVARIRVCATSMGVVWWVGHRLQTHGWWWIAVSGLIQARYSFSARNAGRQDGATRRQMGNQHIPPQIEIDF